jgi:cell division protein FtsB
VTARTTSAKTKKTSASTRRATTRDSRLTRIVTTVVKSSVFRNRRLRRLVTAGAMAGFLLAVFTVPVRDWVIQNNVLNAKKAEFDALADTNEALQTEVNTLQTPEGVRAAARDQLGYVFPGEARIRLLPNGELPKELPNQWPYTLVSGIVAVRQSIAQANNAPLAPLAP